MAPARVETTHAKVAPIILGAYGDTSMARAFAEDLARMIDRGEFDSRGREHEVMVACWIWFPGGTTAASTAAKIEAALS